MTSKTSNKFLQSTKFLIFSACLVLLMGILYLINHITYFTKSVSLYTAQGFSQSEILSLLVPDRLLPGLFEGVGLFFGVSALLFGTAMINQKLSASSFDAVASARAEKEALEAAKVFMSVEGLE